MMRKAFPILALILVCSSASGYVGMQSDGPELDSTVSPGTLITFLFKPFVNDIDETNVVIDFTAAPAVIESIQSEQFQCTVSGTTARCTRDFFPKNTVGQLIKIGVRMPPTGGRVTVSSKISAASGNSSTWSPWVNVASPFYVTNLNSDGLGSFRFAIASANGFCSDRHAPCEIDFQTFGTINLDTPLPVLFAKAVAIDGKKQITLDGHNLDGHGLTYSGDHLTLTGFTIENFRGAGVFLTSGNDEIADSELRGNLRGLIAINTAYLYLHDSVVGDNRLSGVWIEKSSYPAVYENTIENNGASGVYVARGSEFGMVDENTIRGNRDFGVGVSPQAKWTEIRGNSMKSNGQLGIDYALDLVTPNVADDSARPVPNAPAVTSATYDSLLNKTTIIGHVDLRKPADVSYYNAIVDLYASSALDAHGMAQGEKPLNRRSDFGNDVAINSNTGDFSFTYNGDLRGQYITATSTRMYALGKGVTATSLHPRPQYYETWEQTSEMSNPVAVQ